jgi:hypothetical protein
MKIKILTSCAGINFSYASGQIVDVPDKIAKDLIKAGHAEGVKSNGKGDNSAGKRTSKSG